MHRLHPPKATSHSRPEYHSVQISPHQCGTLRHRALSTGCSSPSPRSMFSASHQCKRDRPTPPLKANDSCHAQPGKARSSAPYGGPSGPRTLSPIGLAAAGLRFGGSTASGAEALGPRLRPLHRTPTSTTSVLRAHPSSDRKPQSPSLEAETFSLCAGP